MHASLLHRPIDRTDRFESTCTMARLDPFHPIKFNPPSYPPSMRLRAYVLGGAELGAVEGVRDHDRVPHPQGEGPALRLGRLGKGQKEEDTDGEEGLKEEAKGLRLVVVCGVNGMGWDGMGWAFVKLKATCVCMIRQYPSPPSEHPQTQTCTHGTDLHFD